ncbi:hypothetical protein NDU88_000853 [Pleurodeles waltl]|uniref:Uncharacterized protein n=1 Tax=Pleurodeles waltl TaxID=8319 RepID=A0AAV7Q1Z6_PLEWA|nr:hypothetical protein NDU88_000853 [Pleurodeles waltl]
MSGSEEGFIQVSVRKATFGDDEVRRSQSLTVCLSTEWVLRRMQLRWLFVVLAWCLVDWGQAKLQDRQEKGPWECFEMAWTQAVERPGLRALSTLAL